MWRSETHSTRLSRSHEESIMTKVKACIARHPVPAYFALTFAISWGGVLPVIAGPGGMRGGREAARRSALPVRGPRDDRRTQRIGPPVLLRSLPSPQHDDEANHRLAVLVPQQTFGDARHRQSGIECRCAHVRFGVGISP